MDGSTSRRFKIYGTENDTLLYVTKYSQGYLGRIVPDIASIHALGVDITTITNISNQDLHGMNITYGSSITTLTMRSHDPDETIRIIVQKIMLLSSIESFWIETFPLIGYFNPAIVKWYNFTLCSKRKTLPNQPRGSQKTHLELFWLSNNISNIIDGDLSINHYGISQLNTVIENLGYNYMQDDPRFYVLSNGSLLLTYSSVYNGKIVKYSYVIISLNRNSNNYNINDNAVFSESIELIHPNNELNQKNWIPFQANGSLYFIPTINPLHIIEIDSFHQTNEYMADNQTRKIAKTRTVYKSTRASLPWDESFYGSPRGGTPAYYINTSLINHKNHHNSHHGFMHSHQHYKPYQHSYSYNNSHNNENNSLKEKDLLLLSFFHSCCTSCQSPFKLKTYFMGAITFCPHFPFHIHSMSPLPILQEFLYQGKWLWNTIDYVVYPSSIIFEEDDKEHLFLVFGHQDADAYIAKMHIRSLLSTMQIIHKCNEIE
eukprot:gene4280-6064_t